MQYTYKLKSKCYHIATKNGTLCLAQNGSSLRKYVVADKPPAGRTLCVNCVVHSEPNTKKFVRDTREQPQCSW